MTLHHAPYGDDGASAPLLLQSPRVHDGVDRLLLGGVDEAAGIDENDVGVLRVGRHFRAPIDEFGEIPLGVDRVLVAPHGNDGYLHRVRDAACRVRVLTVITKLELDAEVLAAQ